MSNNETIFMVVDRHGTIDRQYKPNWSAEPLLQEIAREERSHKTYRSVQEFTLVPIVGSYGRS